MKLSFFAPWMLASACALALTASANADSAFSGSGSSGTLASSTETWSINADGGAAVTGYLDNWGSPGVNAGLASYGGSTPALGFLISFSGGGPIDAGSVALGGAACSGTTTGGTAFCNFGLSPAAGWTAFVTGPDSIDFLAQDPSLFLEQGDAYFANVFFDGAAPTSFSGRWLTQYAPTPADITPEPNSLFLLGTGLLACIEPLRRRAGQSAGGEKD